MSNVTVAMTMENFQKIVLEDSKEKLVLVAFWAEQVPESVELKDKLSARVSGAGEHILMTTVDCQAEQQIAAQFGIQGLPTAVLVKDGQPIDGVSGPQTDESIEAFIGKHLPKPEDELLTQAKACLAENDVNQAFGLITQAHQLDAERADIKFILIDVYLQTGKISEAEQLLGTIKMVDQDSDYAALVAKLELANEAADSPEIQALEQAIEKEPENNELKRKLAAQYNQVNRNEEALTILFRLVQQDSSDADSKQLLLDVLKALPDGDPLATKYRRKLYTLMY
ncbi:tetratricopeptide repeat protein [Thalassotalea sp. 1_MG-2023]|uniref:tetratricopeptide repeat protein n=1 Tax=Thalassotalea sp. 1_MG-2023 TaxID=3062680 RepID=UPI0026E3F81E|nr:tetratricopeptide repeat protein [Thalassotalea sp. 1_MG-2023]MDO6427257.1 tetratricopeptide repeat protein [Thalassotalea sp. 1_MG-2023]